MALEPDENKAIQDEDNVNNILKVLDKLAPALKDRQSDIQFLKEFVNSNDFRTLMKTHHKLKIVRRDEMNESLSRNALTLNHMVSYDMEKNESKESQELYDLLTSPHVHSLMVTHDKVTNQDYPVQSILPDDIIKEEEPVQMVRIEKGQQKLGATVKSDSAGNIIIGRVLYGTVADKCGLLHQGDVIHEINGENIHSLSIDEVAERMEKLTGTVVFKISPSRQNIRPHRRNQKIKHIKALFSYDPEKDRLLPCKEAGLKFNERDILLVYDQEDPHWWQASLINDTNNKPGLIPSVRMREKMEYDKANRRLQGAGGHNRRRRRSGKQEVEYSPLDCEEQGGKEILNYEEVIKIDPQTHHPRPIVLMAPNCQPFSMSEVRSNLIISDSSRFGGAVPHTSRPQRIGEVNGQHYNFTSKEDMIRRIQSNQFVEHGEYGGHYYGLSIDTVKTIMNGGKIGLLTIVPRALKLVHLSGEIKPHVVFFVPPTGEALHQWFGTGLVQEGHFRQIKEKTEEMISLYGQYFDTILPYESVDQAIVEIQRLANKLISEPQWVPAIWSA